MPINNACPLCNSRETKVVYWEQAVYNCKHCGLIYTRPQSVLNASIYDEGYHDGSRREGLNFESDWIKKWDQERFVEILNIIEKYQNKGSLLDIGCATGHFLQEAVSRGWRSFGVEISPSACKTAAAVKGAEVYCGPPTAAPFADRKFDLITLNHVLEHIPKPVNFLQHELIPLLKTGGRVYIEVPNIDSREAKVEGSRWMDLRPEQHLFHFNPQSLTFLTEKAGLKVEKVITLPETNYLWNIRNALVDLGISEQKWNYLTGRLRKNKRKQETGYSQSMIMKDYRPKFRDKIIRIFFIPVTFALKKRLKEKRLAVIAKKGD